MADLLVRKSAIISDCGLWRYELRREWDDALPPYAAGMLNPSTADAEIDDPTVARQQARARLLGFGSLIVFNAGAGRATEPGDWKRMDDPIGPDNDGHIRRILAECKARTGTVVVGWGVHGAFRDRDKAVQRIADEVGVQLYCLGLTKDGHPRHPLYVSYLQPLINFPRWPGA